MQDFNINHLLVWHRLRELTGVGMSDRSRTQLQAETFFVSTCMREFAVTTRQVNLPHQVAESGLQSLHGAAAYAFLLRTVTGLNSSIPGETNIQGQLRKAWDSWREAAAAQRVAMLTPLLQRLFADGSNVRRKYLQGIGGHSYGSLTRKLLNPDGDARVLLVGAGELARSVAPFFRNRQTAVWNRHAPAAGAIDTALMFAPQEIAAAAAWATHVVITTPPDSINDALWADVLRSAAQLQKVVHLGLRRACRGSWQGFAACHDLDDVIEFRRSQTSLRSMRIAQARAACDAIVANYPATAGNILVSAAA